MRRHRLRTAFLCALLVSGCGGGPSLSDYAAEAEALIHEMNAALDAAEIDWHEGEQTIEGARVYFRARADARSEFVDDFEALEPHPSAAGFHGDALDLVGRLAHLEERMADLAQDAETAADLEAIVEGPLRVEYQDVDAAAIAFCHRAQAEFDATQAGESFEGVAWIPAEMQETVIVAFRCTAEERGLQVP